MGNQHNHRLFWAWDRSANTGQRMHSEEGTERTLYLDGTISDDSWLDEDGVTPRQFRDELFSGSGDITVWINSPGGDCICAAQIYNMLKEYPHTVTVKIDGIAASAASVIAMAGDRVLMSPLSLMFLHNPLTMAMGDAGEMQRAADMLNEVKESIINAYTLKTGLSRAKLAHLMDSETWLSADRALELGFADGILYRENPDASNALSQPFNADTHPSMGESSQEAAKAQHKPSGSPAEDDSRQPGNTKTILDKTGPTGRSIDELLERLDFISQHT